MSDDLNDLARDIRGYSRVIGRYLWYTGDRLIKAKELLPHGGFGPWLRNEFDWSERTAQGLMQIRRAFDAPEKVAFGRTVAAMLARDGVPEPAREEAVQRAAGGETITPKKATEIVARHSPPPPPAGVPAVEDDTPFDEELRQAPVAPRRQWVRSTAVPSEPGVYTATHRETGVETWVHLTRDGRRHLRAELFGVEKTFDPTDWGDYERQELPSRRRRKPA